jgi:hypothetical protein
LSLAFAFSFKAIFVDHMQTLRLKQLRIAGALYFQEIVLEAVFADQMESLMRHALPAKKQQELDSMLMRSSRLKQI